MAEAQHTADARILVGIDISKNRHGVLIAVPGKPRGRRVTVLNTADDYLRLIALLRGFELPVTIGFEGQTMGLAATITGPRCTPWGRPVST